MSYRHVADGRLKLSQYGQEHLTVLQNILNSSVNLEDSFETVEFSTNGDNIWLDVQNWSWQNYNEDSVKAFLKEIVFFIKEGESIDFRGEDDEHWRFIKVSGGWEEQNGYIEYKKGWLI